MNFKKIFTIMIVLFIALGVSGVSASDIIDDDSIISIDTGDLAIGADSDVIAIEETGGSSGNNQSSGSNSTVDSNSTESNSTEGNATEDNSTENTTVLKDTEIVAENVVYKINNEKKYNVTLLSNKTPVANQTVTFTINDIEEYNATTNDDGVATLDISFLQIGDYSIGLKYAGNDEYNASTAQSIIKIFTTIEADNVVKYYKNDTQFEATLYDSNGNIIVNKTATVEINGVKYNRTTKADGTIKFNINLNPGNYSIKVTNPVTKDSLTRLVTVLPVVLGENIELYFRNGTQYVATFIDGQGNPLSGVRIQFNINGIFYNRTTKANGTAAITINLNPGEYTITAINTVNNGMNSNKIKVLPTISGDNIKLYWQNGTAYNATFLDNNGNPLNGTRVQFNINGVLYNRTTKANGNASIVINLGPGKYTITAINPKTNAMHSNQIEVLSIIDAKDFSKTWNTSGKFTFKTLDKQGNIAANQSVDLNINGEIYHRTTNENGSASLNINLIPGTYVCTMSYNGLVQGFKITVNKLTPTVAIVSSTVKVGGNYSAKITYDKKPIAGLRVYYVIDPYEENQRVYAYNTNSEGIVNAPIQLPVGKYSFAIGIQDETFYSNVFLATTLNVVE